jgi:16S rRNA (cytidine1402-2'-O)-methyltransferase
VPAPYPDLVTGRLILCASPIGNLGDASPRLREALAAADVVYAEDTRRSRTLLESLDLSRPLRSFFVGNEQRRAVELGERLAAGATIALITDAGTPAISDPGLVAVRAAVDAGADVTVVPGPSALTAALAVSGLPADRFVFEGFLPRKGAARTERLAALAGEARTAVLFAATSRVGRDLADLAKVLGADRDVVVARELTKQFEELWRGTLGEAAAHWGEDGAARGEFTLVIAGTRPAPPDWAGAVAAVDDAISKGASMTEAVREVAGATGLSRRELYERVLDARRRALPDR